MNPSSLDPKNPRPAGPASRLAGCGKANRWRSSHLMAMGAGGVGAERLRCRFQGFGVSGCGVKGSGIPGFSMYGSRWGLQGFGVTGLATGVRIHN